MSEPKQLTEGQFYRWQLATTQLTVAKLERRLRETEVDISALHARAAQRDYEIKSLNLRLDIGLESSKIEFNKQIDTIEKDAGFKIRGMAMNETTFEVFSDEDLKSLV